MKRILALILFLPVLALATVTTTQIDGKTTTIAFSTGTESDPTTDATMGIRIEGFGGCTVHAESATNATAGGIYKAWLYNNVSGNWTRVGDGSLDLTTIAATKQSWPAIKIVSDINRVTWVPSGVGVASTLYLICTQK